ncbi:MAG: hypothetical protein M3466_13460 [Gemmatimonadota bacterium]|nr:hypothetical protein [Gemmatimonadota bacterium]
MSPRGAISSRFPADLPLVVPERFDAVLAPDFEPLFRTAFDAVFPPDFAALRADFEAGLRAEVAELFLADFFAPLFLVAIFAPVNVMYFTHTDCK